MAGPIPAGPAGPGGGGGEDLLRQIRMLLDQYLAMGDQTPVAPEAQALAQAIDQAAPGAAGPEGGPDMGGASAAAGPSAPPPTDVGAIPPDMMLPQEGEPPRDTKKKSFGEANKSASDRLKKRNSKK